MKSIKIAVSCLVAVFLLSATTAVAASAAKPERPEFFRCEKTAKVNKKYTGEFSNKECTAAAVDGKYGLTKIQGEAPAFTLKSKGAIFTADGKAVECKKGAGGGELEAEGWAEESVTITLSKCHITGNKPCSNILITVGVSELYYTSEQEVEAELFLHVDEPFEIKCGSETFVVENSVIGAVKNSKKGETITFEVSDGKQALEYKWAEEERLNAFPKYLESNGSEVTLKAVLEEKNPKGVGVFF